MTTPSPPAPSRPRLHLGAAAAATLVLVILSVAVGVALLRGQAAPAQIVSETPAVVLASAELYVHVLGEVRRPGLYLLREDARVVDALAAAGGATPDAALSGVNLARPLSDGEQIVVPAASAEGEAPTVADGRIDLNAADAAALESLPGIGPALARRIVAWREENGRFGAVDDLLAVSGIGAKVLAGLREAVRV